MSTHAIQRVPLAVQAAEILRRRMAEGAWTSHLPGERDLAQQLRISRPVLRAALDQLRREGSIGVTPGQRRRVLRPAARHVAIARSTTIGLLSPVPLQSAPPFVMFWMDALRARLAEAGFQLEIHVSRACFAAQPARALESLVHRAPAAAWVLFLSNERMQRWFAEQRHPCLVAGTAGAGLPLPSVDVDYRAACRHAVGVLHRKGHTRLALLLPDAGYAGDQESETGFREGLLAGQSAVVLRHDGTRSGIAAQLDGALRKAAPPTGFLVARSAHVLTVMTHLLQRGVGIPRDAAVISRDDDAFLEFVTPSVARYVSQPEQFARRVSRLVIQLAQTGAASPHPVRLMPRYLPGGTV